MNISFFAKVMWSWLVAGIALSVLGGMLGDLAVLAAIFMLVGTCMVLLYSLTFSRPGEARVFSWIVYARSWCTPGSMPVELWDFSGERRISLATRDDQGQLVAYWYDWHLIGRIILDPDGIVSRKSDASYVYFWLPLRAQERAQHLLSLDFEFPDFSTLEHVKDKTRQMMDWYETIQNTRKKSSQL